MRRSRLLSAIIAVAIGLCSSVVYGQQRQAGGVGLTIFADRNFRGRSATLRGDTPDLREIGMNDAARSLQVGPGEQWEVCEDINYQGRCVVVSGSDPDLRRTEWDRKISSARRVRGGAGVRPPTQTGGLELFSGTGFSGDRRAFNGPEPDLRRVRFNATAQSLRLGRGETWQVCADTNYRNCLMVNTDWQDLRGLGMFRRINSVRPWQQVSGGGQMSIVLFDDRGLRGRSVRVDRATGILSGFVNRAESVQVTGGSWQLCDGTNFSGRCVVVSSSLSDLSTVGLRNRVASVRPVPSSR